MNVLSRPCAIIGTGSVGLDATVARPQAAYPRLSFREVEACRVEGADAWAAGAGQPKVCRSLRMPAAETSEFIPDLAPLLIFVFSLRQRITAASVAALARRT
jgi:hypothetical protein